MRDSRKFASPVIWSPVFGKEKYLHDPLNCSLKQSLNHLTFPSNLVERLISRDVAHLPPNTVHFNLQNIAVMYNNQGTNLHSQLKATLCCRSRTCLYDSERKKKNKLHEPERKRRILFILTKNKINPHTSTSPHPSADNRSIQKVWSVLVFDSFIKYFHIYWWES